MIDSKGVSKVIKDVFVERSAWNATVGLWLPLTGPFDRPAPMAQFEVSQYERAHDGEALPFNMRPSLALTSKETQCLFDALWADGWRPSKESPEELRGELAAVRRHLEDFRALYAGERGIKL